MIPFSILLAGLLLDPQPQQVARSQGMEAGRVALGRVCLPGILEARPIAALAKEQGMVAMPPSSVGAGAADRVWRLGLAKPVYAVAWADGSCTAIIQKGDKAAVRTLAETLIVARPEGFQRGPTGLYDGGRIERVVYCAQVKEGWAVISISLPGPSADARTRAFSSTTYLRPTRSTLCG